MTETLVIMLLLYGTPFNKTHQYTFETHGYLARQTCIDHKLKMLDQVKDNPNIEIIYLDCPDWWTKT